MKILVVGGGGREHALAWRLAKDGHTVAAAPGNPGMDAERVAISVGDVDALVSHASEWSADLVVVGPEAPLVAGLADRLREQDIAVFGPGAKGAQLEGSKAFSKEFFARHGIKSADFRVCRDLAQAKLAIDELGDRVVVKADGLAAGKGVVVCSAKAEAVAAAENMLGGQFGDAGHTLVIEQRLSGRELSVMALTDGARIEVLAQAEDHKAIYDGDKGPNTGGMGTVSPAAWATDELLARIRRDVLEPTVRGLAADGIDYRGVLYAGLMVDEAGTPWLLEYNCRFGDPETQPVMARLKGDLGAHLLGAARGQLPATPLEWDARCAVCVVLASPGYPGKAETGRVIEGLGSATSDDLVIFHAGTKELDGRVVTSGGRVLGVTALGRDAEDARRKAYRALELVRFEGMQFRRDIGARA